MEVNNAIYDTLGHMWWSDDAGFEFTSLRFCMNPLRHGYFSRQLRQLDIRGGALLDIGCGGGFLSEAFAQDGFRVTGIDPSANSLAAARAHAAHGRLAIDYREGRGESLPFEDASFDVVACCDVLEHVDDPRQVIREVARVLKPGGVFLYDTPNRTRMSKFVVIKVWQDWDLAGTGLSNLHVWEKFIRPAELIAMLGSAGLSNGGMSGVSPVKSPLVLLYRMWQVRKGRIRGEAVGQAFAMRESDDVSTSYLGWARKQ